ncbi:hypothetical protein [Kitasatospora sp. NBC_01539]|uniref:SCO2583/SCO2584 N-terminal domain-containing protein n=1 Tax=Kitasatospora sp. NBC_01539 TaxID=2903577 RepID=UPI0038602BB6
MPIVDEPGPRPDDPFENLVLDEDFVRGADVKEQSGRSRMLAARWKQQPPDPEPWRASADRVPARRSRFGRRPKPVDPWGRRRKRNWQTPVFVVLAAAVTLAALNVDRLNGWYEGRQESSALPPVAPETASPTAAPPAVDPDTPTADHPWAGSPAEAWPSGANGIELPAAQALGVFDRTQVAAQLKAVKDYLVLAHLDPATTAGGTPAAALALLDRKDRTELEAALAHPTAEHDPVVWLSRFDPRLAVPVTEVVKVLGRTTFESDGDRGMLVHTDYTYVYALRPGPDVGRAPASPAAGATARPVGWTTAGGDVRVEREIVRRQQDFRFYNPARYQVQRGKLVLDKGQSAFGNNVCTMGSGYLVTSFPESAEDDGPSGAPTGGPTTDPYDRRTPLEEGDGSCGALSRT